ncbi:Molybdenum cofactor cytidylyltransferase [Bremerella volcania]|uniref:Molybdenum cofactor cytidylyltransferase n=1 Tax=Bremerella volcania TaxID=2527984 RepID=A0A518C6I5_9BACT|nr:nucleotidyltransferase family protein [Bremerella volcania]QDU74821.1 Molybdenum cofactor cytidylyltransferase [Bremerella volcania]
MTKPRRSFAIIPACGESRRMGTDKLLLPWSDSTILETVIAAWQKSEADHIFVVIPQERRDLRNVLQNLAVHVIAADPRPADMKGSIQLGLQAIESRFSPTQDDVWLVAPADMPTLSSRTINLVLREAERHPGRIVVPINSEKRGHPVLLPWSCTSDVYALASDQGINALLAKSPPLLVPVEQLGNDVDTPAQYQSLRNNLQ